MALEDDMMIVLSPAVEQLLRRARRRRCHGPARGSPDESFGGAYSSSRSAVPSGAGGAGGAGGGAAAPAASGSPWGRVGGAGGAEGAGAAGVAGCTGRPCASYWVTGPCEASPCEAPCDSLNCFWTSSSFVCACSAIFLA